MFFSKNRAIENGANTIARSNREIAEAARRDTLLKQQKFDKENKLDSERFEFEKDSQVNLENYKKDVVKCLFEIVNSNFKLDGGDCFRKPYLAPELHYNYSEIGRRVYLLKNKDIPISLYRLEECYEDDQLLDSLKDTIKNLHIEEVGEKVLSEEDIFN